MNDADEAQVHETARVDEGATLGARTRVWHFTHVCSGAVLGDDCSLGQNVFVAGSVRLGNHVRVQNNVSLYDGVQIEDDVFLGPSCVFTNVGNPRSHVSRKSEFADTVVKRGATVGANATVVCGNTIGEYAFVGAGAVVTHDVEPHALVVGSPARRKGWACRCGEILPASGRCDRCGTQYRVSEDACVEA